MARIAPTAIFWRTGICSRRSQGLDADLSVSAIYNICHTSVKASARVYCANIHGDGDGGKVCEDTQSGICEIKHRPVHARAGRDAQVPRLGDWAAAENVGQNTGNRVSAGDENDGPDCNVEIATREDSKVEDENGDFGETGCGAIDDRSNDIMLKCPQKNTVVSSSASERVLSCWNRHYMRTLRNVGVK